MEQYGLIASVISNNLRLSVLGTNHCIRVLYPPKISLLIFVLIRQLKKTLQTFQNVGDNCLTL